MGDQLRHRNMGARVIPLALRVERVGLEGGALLSVERFIRLRRVPTVGKAGEKDGKDGMKIGRDGMTTAEGGMTTGRDGKTIGEGGMTTGRDEKTIGEGEAISEGEKIIEEDDKVIETTTDKSEKSASAKARKEEE